MDHLSESERYCRWPADLWSTSGLTIWNSSAFTAVSLDLTWELTDEDAEED